MVKKLKILMVDDHPLILEGYMSKLKESFEGGEFQLLIDTAHDCDEAYFKIENAQKNGKYDVIVLDINLPASKNRRFLSGEDLGIEIRKISPTTSLFVLTMRSESPRLLNILKNLNPDAFMIKSDVIPSEFLEAFNKVREGKIHYSQSVTEIIRKRLTTKIELNEQDRSILYYLAEGIRTKDLPTYIPLSLASIEKRKKLMKELFDIEKEGDLALIKKAQLMGFL
jgi:DNA-binding NarL/FixJ family response regulator